MAKNKNSIAAIMARIDALVPAVRKGFLDSIADIKSEAQLSLIVYHLERGDFDTAVAALNIRAEFFAPFDDAIRAAYLEGGRAAIAALPVLKDPANLGKLLSALTVGASGRKHF